MEPTSFDCLVVNRSNQHFEIKMETLTWAELPQGEVTIEVHYSSFNYKDALACSPNGNIVQSYPFIPGIDLAGTILSSLDPRFTKGMGVLVTGFGLGVTHFGGFSQIAKVPAAWVVPLPDLMKMDEAMTIGTAGFTAAISIERLEQNGMKPQSGPILVTGASGGVGSFAIALLASRGYEVVASTGKTEEHDFLRLLGASEIIHRDELKPGSNKPLHKSRWAAAIDPVGGPSLAYILSSIHYGGSVAVSGLTGGTDIPTTVLPFILRNINLLGIDSVHYPIELRKEVWERMAVDLQGTDLLNHIRHEIPLKDVPDYVSPILSGKIKGRMVVKINK